MSERAEKAYGKRGAVYCCSFCQYRGDKQQTTRHLAAKHLSRDQVPYACELCSKIALKLVEMEKHFQEKHKTSVIAADTVRGTKSALELQQSDATMLTRQESIDFYSSTPSSKAVTIGENINNGKYEPSLPSLSSSSEDILGMLKDYPSLLEKVQDIVELKRAISSIETPPEYIPTPKTPKISVFPTTMPPRTEDSGVITIESPNTDDRPVKDKETPPSPKSTEKKKISSTPKLTILPLDDSTTPPPRSKDSTPSHRRRRPKFSPTTSSTDTTNGRQKLKGEKQQSAPERSTPIVDLHPTDREIQDFLQRPQILTPLKNEPIRKNNRPNKDQTPTDRLKRQRNDKDLQEHEAPTEEQKRRRLDENQDTAQADLVPLSAVGELVEKSIYNAVDAVSSAIIVAAKKQPIPPAQDLRPVTNQLMATNTNLAQIAGILSATNTKHSDLTQAINELTKTTSSLASQLSRMNRAVAVLTEVANKMDQHMVEQTGTNRTLVQSSIDSHTALTEAMRAQTGSFNTVHNRLTSVLKTESPSNQVSSIVKKILKLEAPTAEVKRKETGQKTTDKPKTETTTTNRRVKETTEDLRARDAWRASRTPRHSARSYHDYHRPRRQRYNHQQGRNDRDKDRPRTEREM